MPKRVYTIWPADRDGLPARTESAWQQDTRWLVLDITDAPDRTHVVEGPVSRATAIRREQEVRAVAKAAATNLNGVARSTNRRLVGSGAP